ncbi:hemolysin family protein [Nesterenkonia xinjiangensis]|uniref:CBS domain containing-hemolysin-like protein n=1 Tax=Nesterenkonia xinjiangensis TaxID=225327 RepID=A0A7Z0KCB1_9MICC|nr:hemolysin family protein [Nesterenkonia xinjiangensis]NYJ78472.1 CBS domain containing-hemolysin-like protein [Nesterenkonia xinjiangensis]
MTAILLLALGCFVILLIIAANAYFVAQEFAYMSVDRTQLRTRAASGDVAASRALEVTDRTSFMLSGAQLGITVTGLLVGYVAEPLVGEALGDLLSMADVPRAAAVGVGTVVALAVSTVVQMIFGELFPKNYAIANPTVLALRLAGSTRMYLAVFGWLIMFFDRSANALLRLLRIEPVHDVNSTADVHDLEHIVDESRQSGELPEDLFLVLDRVLDFPDHDVEHAMIPRTQAGIVAPDTTIGEVRELMADEHTRYPIIDAADAPVGVVHLLDVLATSHPRSAPVTELMRPPVILPTLMPMPEAVEELRCHRSQFACVIDEYGGFAGVISLEDLAEEILGELTDEHDEEIPLAIVPIGGCAWQMEGAVHVDEVERAVGHDLPRGDFETLSGLIIHEAGGLPSPGDRICIDLPWAGVPMADEPPLHRWLDVEVCTVQRHVPHTVTVELKEAEL